MPPARYAQEGGATRSARVLFSHPSIKPDLVLNVNPNQIIWSYGLNTANFSTYGGEVVQILSMFFDDMSLTGDIRSYKDAETIYSWFLRYLQEATQGTTGRGIDAHDPRPVNFLYPGRGWQFKIYPKTLPNFRYGLEVVAPSYTIQASVAEPDADFAFRVETEAKFNAEHKGEFDTFGKATAAIGFREDNPFSGPTSQVYKAPDYFKKTNKMTADWFNNLIPAYQKGQFSDLEPTSKVPSIPGLPKSGNTSSGGRASTGGSG